MRTSLPPKYTWSDAELTDAVRASACWRDVARALGLTTTSEGVMRRVRRHAERLGLDVSHFKGTRTWDDAQLRRAVADGLSWDDVLTALGLHTPGKQTRVRVMGHALRLGLDLSHLQTRTVRNANSTSWDVDIMRLRDAGVSIAAAWFTLHGCIVSFPIEQAAYDLLVHTGGRIAGVQVKTTTTRVGNRGQVTVGRRPYSAGSVAPLMPYDPKVISYFFIVDGDMNMYLIPSRVVAGRVGLQLRTYQRYIVGNVGGLLAANVSGPGPQVGARVSA